MRVVLYAALVVRPFAISIVQKNAKTLVQTIAYMIALMHVVDVLIFVTPALVCVSVHARSNVSKVVLIVQICVRGGATLNAELDADPIALSVVSIVVVVAVQQR